MYLYTCICYINVNKMPNVKMEHAHLTLCLACDADNRLRCVVILPILIWRANNSGCSLITRLRLNNKL